MIRRILRHIRRQPRATRESYAFSGAVTVTACIALVWMAYLPSRLSHLGTVQVPDIADTQETAPETVRSNPTPFSSFFSRLQASVSEFRDDPGVADQEEIQTDGQLNNATPPNLGPENATKTEATTEPDTIFRTIDQNVSHSTSTDD